MQKSAFAISGEPDLSADERRIAVLNAAFGSKTGLGGHLAADKVSSSGN
jgi:hypothetical protein